MARTVGRGPYRVDSQNPVADHPLNRGLVSWWLPLPHLVGGRRLWDLRNRAHGTLTSFPATGAEWVAQPNGFGGLLFDGSNDHVTAATQVTTVTDNVTLEVAVRPSGFTTNATMLNIGDGGGSANGYSIAIGAAGDAAGQSLMLLIPGIDWFDMGYTFATANLWYHVVVGRDAGTWKAWVNGVATASTTTTTPGTPAVRFGIGARVYSSTVNYFAGLIGHASVRTVAPSSAMARALYEQWQTGFPNLLNRYPERTWFVLRESAEATGGGVPLGSLSLLGVGR